ncbi:MAG: hypothetical protein QOG59_2506, partial [Solirubrobacteraceae bacterium]|nr:hypothetical protein [Solirubrobacteraceae bacterium]
AEEAERAASSADDWYETERLTGQITGGARALAPRPGAMEGSVGLGWRHAELLAPPSRWERLRQKFGQRRRHRQGLAELVVEPTTDAADEHPSPAAADHQHRTSGTVRRWAAMGGLIVIGLAGTAILSGSGPVKNAAGLSGSRLARVSVASVNTVAANVIGAGQTVLHHVRANQGHHRMASEHRRSAPSKLNRVRAVVQVSPISTDYRTVPAMQAPSVVTQPARPVYQAQPTSYRPVSHASASAKPAGPTGQGTLVGPASCGC